MFLTRYRYEAGCQCRLRLWNDLNAPHLATEEERSATGDDAAVRLRARDRYPDGVLVSPGRREGAAETRRLVEAKVAAVFGATFECEGMMSSVDVMERLPVGGWRLVRVKSAKNPKPRYDASLAFDLWVSRRAGFEVRDAGLLLLNGEYIYDGVRLDPEGLFRYHSRLAEVEGLLPETARKARTMCAALAAEDAPAIAPGAHCREPFLCSYYGHCSRNLRVPAHGIDELPGLRQKRREKLVALGIEEIEDIPPIFDLSDLQQVARRSVEQQRTIVHGDLKRRLDEIEPPVRHLDFETYMPPIPRFAGTSPFEPIPFLFSVHTEERSELGHDDYLHEESDDPRPVLARRLLAALGETGSICVYSSYEKRILKSLARSNPEFASDIDAVVRRLYDLCPVIRSTVYDPAFRGSFSLKKTFPALVLDSGYDDLEVSEGMTAATLYGQVIEREDETERRRVFARLRDYCERDTLAMAKLRHALVALASGERRR